MEYRTTHTMTHGEQNEHEEWINAWRARMEALMRQADDVDCRIRTAMGIYENEGTEGDAE